MRANPRSSTQVTCTWGDTSRPTSRGVRGTTNVRCKVGPTSGSRAGHEGRMRKLALLIGGPIVVAGLAFLSFAGAAGDPEAALSRVSAVGQPVVLPPGDPRTENLVAGGYG